MAPGTTIVHGTEITIMQGLTPGALICITIRGPAGALALTIIWDGLTWAGAVIIPGAGADGGGRQYIVHLIAGRLTMEVTEVVTTDTATTVATPIS